MPMPTGSRKIPNFTDSERLKTPKTDCALKVYKDNSICLDTRFVDLENTEFPATLTIDLSIAHQYPLVQSSVRCEC